MQNDKYYTNNKNNDDRKNNIRRKKEKDVVDVHNIYIDPLNISDKKSYQVLNSNNPYYCLQKSPDFVPIQYNAGDNFQIQKGYQSMDPRTYDPVRNIRLTLDRPPVQVSNTQPLQEIYSMTNDTCKDGFYCDYGQIFGGDIVYYNDLEQTIYDTDPYVLPSYVTKTVIQDPMGALLPQYNKTPIYENNPQVGCYRSDRDQMFFREDLMALQSRKINQSDYSFYHNFETFEERTPLSVWPPKNLIHQEVQNQTY